MKLSEYLKNNKGTIFEVQNFTNDLIVKFIWGTYDRVTEYFTESYGNILDTEILIECEDESCVPKVILQNDVLDNELFKLSEVLVGNAGGINRRLLTDNLLPKIV